MILKNSFDYYYLQEGCASWKRMFCMIIKRVVSDAKEFSSVVNLGNCDPKSLYSMPKNHQFQYIFILKLKSVLHFLDKKGKRNLLFWGDYEEDF